MGTLEHQRLLAESELRFPINEWIVGGVRAWPYLRIMLSFKLALAECGVPEGSGTAWRDRFRRRIRSASSVLDAFTAPLQDPGGSAPRVQKGDVFTFTCSTGRQAELAGRFVNTLCHPIFDTLRAQGRSFHSWEFSLVEPYRIPRASRSYMVQRKLLEIYAKSFMPGPPLPLHLPRYEEWLKFLETRNARLKDLEQAKVTRWFREVLEIADLFEAALERIDPQLVLTSNLSRYEMALYVACRRRGILSVELQHGLQGTLVGRYSGWTRVPPEGYDLLPEAYWCWDPESADAINSWSSACRPHHQARASGNPWLEYCRSLDLKSLNPKFASVLSDYPGRNVALVTLPFPAQPYPNGTLLPDALVESMARIGSEWRWWIRYHPLMKRDYRPLERFLRERSIDAVLRAATELPLFALLNRVNAHLTHSSATVLDANLFGIRSVVWTEYGRDYYKSAIADGYCAYATDAEGIMRELRQIAAKGKCVPRFSQPPLAESLDYFLERARERKAASRS